MYSIIVTKTEVLLNTDTCQTKLRGVFSATDIQDKNE